MSSSNRQSPGGAATGEAAAQLPAFLTSDPGGCRVRLHVQPRAKAAGLAGLHGDRLKVRVRAAPVAGAANTECVELLAARLHVSRAAVRLLRGARGRDKDFAVRGVSPHAAAAALAADA